MYTFMKRKYRAKSKTINGELYKELHKNIDEVQTHVGNSDDLVVRYFFLGKNRYKSAAIIYMDGLTDLRVVEDLMAHSDSVSMDRDVWARAQSYFEQFGEITEIKNFQEMFNHLLQGQSICIIDGFAYGVGLDIGQWPERQIEVSQVEKVIRGPKESFVENVRVNTSLIRRRIKDENLWFESRTIGKRTKTRVVLGYLNGVADEAVLTELRTRLDRINTDAINSTGELEELIQDEFYTPFPTVYGTERPDTTASQILEGKIAIIVDGTPFVLIVPALFVQFFQSAEDYSQRADIGTAIRLLRFLSVFFALLTPSFYIAFTTYHQELIPFNLLISLAAQSEGTPFPTIVEVFILEITFEIIREAGVRMPQPVGQTLSIVGGLIIGTAVVEAGVISATVVIVVAFTAISSFMFPTYAIGVPIRILRFFFLLLSGIFGLYGIFLGFTVMILHLCGLKSFGVPYLSGLSPFRPQDTLIRLPKWMMNSRPHLLSKEDEIRQDTPKPAPKQSRGR